MQPFARYNSDIDFNIYSKYYRPRSHHVEVAASGDPRANEDSTLKCKETRADVKKIRLKRKDGHRKEKKRKDESDQNQKNRTGFFDTERRRPAQKLTPMNPIHGTHVKLIITPENTTPVPADTRTNALPILPAFRADISRFAKKRKRRGEREENEKRRKPERVHT
ncbi:LOW QUALITY PROTEIN: hypothetical protein V1477_012888 [Vespula maculifrons]|uniref:Uncharacterized protein n=1 Tax=Vespula maculifrons TaxID=7453 RepID=A0ABD2BUU9_VESMC